MIFEVIFSIIGGILRAIFFIFQILPDMPSVITNVGDTLATYASTGMGFFFEVLGKPLGVAVLTLVPIYLTFKLTFSLTIFIWRLIKL